MSIFIANLIPQDQICKFPNISQAAHNFCYSFIEAINTETTYSLIPLNIKNKNKFNFSTLQIIPIQYRILPHKSFLRIFNILLENLVLCFYIIKTKKDNIWFYNLNIHNVSAFIILRFLFIKKCFVIVADLDPDIQRFNWNYIIVKLLSKANAIIAFSSNTCKTIPNKNIMVIPGIVDEKKIQQGDITKTINRKQVLFSGTLIELTGLDLALETFSELKDIDLLITGSGDYKKVLSYSEKFSNIIYLGFLDYKEYLTVLNSVDFVLNLRNPEFIENNHNFPSKVLEYLLNRKIVISTLQYDSLPENTLFCINYNKQNLKSKICELISKSDFELNRIADINRLTVLTQFSFSYWQNAVIKLENVV